MEGELLGVRTVSLSPSWPQHHTVPGRWWCPTETHQVSLQNWADIENMWTRSGWCQDVLWYLGFMLKIRQPSPSSGGEGGNPLGLGTCVPVSSQNWLAKGTVSGAEAGNMQGGINRTPWQCHQTLWGLLQAPAAPQLPRSSCSQAKQLCKDQQGWNQAS